MLPTSSPSGTARSMRCADLPQVAGAAHNVTVYSFDPLPDCRRVATPRRGDLRTPSPKAATPQPDGSWRDWTILQFSDFFRMRLMASAPACGSMPRAAAQAGRDRSRNTYFAWERPRQLAIQCSICRDDPIVAAFAKLMSRGVDADWLALRIA